MVPQAAILATHIYAGLLLLKHPTAEGSGTEYSMIELQVGSCFTALECVAVYMHGNCRGCAKPRQADVSQRTAKGSHVLK